MVTPGNSSSGIKFPLISKEYPSPTYFPEPPSSASSAATQKSGFSKDGLFESMEELLQLEGIEIVGLMNIAPINASEERLHYLFADIRKYRDYLEEKFQTSLPELSMGMSNDYKVAIEEGATTIRIGRELFK